jgi:hypothetical protein
MTTITYTFPGFPQINQLTDRYGGVLDINASWDCVPASLSDGLTFLTGNAYHEYELKSAVYGAGYQGGQAAVAYVSYCARQGVLLAPFDGSPAQLVARVHAEIAAGHPVIATIPSLWGIPVSQQSGSWTSHVVCFAGQGPGALRADNPWIAPTWQDQPDSYWEAELVDNQIWIMSKNGAATMGIPSGWTDSAGGDPNNGSGVLTAPNGVKVTQGFRHTVLTNGWLADNVPLSDAHGANPCDPTNTASGDGTNQLFKYFLLVWHKSNNTISTVGAGQVVQSLEASANNGAKYTALRTAIEAALTNN